MVDGSSMSRIYVKSSTQMNGMSASCQMSFKCGDIKNGIVCVYYHPKMR